MCSPTFSKIGTYLLGSENKAHAMDRCVANAEEDDGIETTQHLTLKRLKRTPE
jgi:hypothetical protein